MPPAIANDPESSRRCIKWASDIIPTGTPSGVGLGMKPPQFLKPGDRMRLSVEGLGEQNQRLVAFTG